MVKYRIHENGWTVILEDFDLRDSDQEDINHIARLIASSTCVVIRNQTLTIEDELRIISMFQNPNQFLIDFVEGNTEDETFKGLAADPVKDPTGILLRITGELRDGLQGGAGWDGEFSWHCNQPEDPSRRPIVWLYGIRGTAGSRTSWNNTILAYSDLDDVTKDRIANLHSIYGNFNAPEDTQYHDTIKYNDNWTPALVYKNIANRIGMYFSPLQVKKFVELTQQESDDLIKMLGDHVLQEKYLYHHDWRDGDIVISEQWLGVHKRWPFDKMSTRLLHRAAMDFPEQDYTKNG